MQGGWAVDLGAPGPNLTVGLFQGGRLARVTSFATVGLSEFPLAARTAERGLRIELIGCSYSGTDEGYGPWPGILEHLAKVSVKSARAILRGDVIGLPGEIEPGSRLNALYATLPVYFDDSFSSVNAGDGRQVAMVWLVPIGGSEVDLVKKAGWRAFENDLMSRDPDLLDLGRALVV
jgi:Suppressor of fused protein (SUFU)